MTNEYLIHVAGTTETPHVRFDAAGAMAIAKQIIDALNNGKEVRIKYVWPDPNLTGRHVPSVEEQRFISHFVDETTHVPPEAWEYFRKHRNMKGS